MQVAFYLTLFCSALLLMNCLFQYLFYKDSLIRIRWWIFFCSSDLIWRLIYAAC